MCWRGCQLQQRVGLHARATGRVGGGGARDPARRPAGAAQRGPAARTGRAAANAATGGTAPGRAAGRADSGCAAGDHPGHAPDLNPDPGTGRAGHGHGPAAGTVT
eukprot:356560-Chlamydomonas_euryale.AAC.2